MDKTEQFNFFRARSISEIINGTFAFIRQEFAPLGKSILIILGPFIVAMALVMYYFFDGILLFQTTQEFTAGFIIFYLLILILGFVVFTVIVSLINSYILLYIDDDDTRYSPGDVFNISFKRFWSIAKVNFLLFLLLMAGYFIFGIVIVILMSLAASSSMAFLPAILLFSLFFPIIYFFIAISFVYIITLHENLRFFAALKRSVQLIREYWWFTFGLYFLIALIVFVLQIIFMIPNWIVTYFITFNQAETQVMGELSPFVGLMMAFSVISYFLHNIYFVTIAIHYFSQREKKEASSLAQKINTLDNGPVLD